MSFSAEHYIKVAGVIRELKVGSYTLKEDMVEAFKEMFEKDNPKFNPIEFIDACYSEE
jgi:hypothetical protein